MGSRLLIDALMEPARTADLSASQWTALYRQARATGLLGRLAAAMQHHAEIASVQLFNCPKGLQGHFEAATRLCQAQAREVHREAKFIDHALHSLGAPVVLLKGAAYAMAGLPAAQGRVFSDIDIMVPKSHLQQAESLLMMNGWMSTETSAYNQRYYRQWMHELPPMQHVHRSTVLDVHHAILPQTARMRPDAALLLADAVPLPGSRTLHVLAPADMVLHSMTHLFVNDDMTHALRDLSDLNLLVRHFSTGQAWWDLLAARAIALDLTRPLYHALTQLRRVWGTPMPAAAVTNLGLGNAAAPSTANAVPTGLAAAAMAAIWDQVFTVPAANNVEPLVKRLALFALYLRGHWLRMPAPLLVRHLSIKALGLHQSRQAKTAGAESPAG